MVFQRNSWLGTVFRGLAALPRIVVDQPFHNSPPGLLRTGETFHAFPNGLTGLTKEDTTFPLARAGQKRWA